MTTAKSTEQELVITRVFDAPRERVFKAWTEPEYFARWWGPEGYTTPHCTIDLRPGGKWHCCMRSPEGEDIWCGGVYREIVAPERIVCTDYFADEEGGMVEPSHYGMGDWPTEVLMTITFEEQDGRTKLTVHQGVPMALAEKMGAPTGWNSSFDCLDEYLAKLRV